MLKLFVANNLRKSEEATLESINGLRQSGVNHIVVTPDRMAQSTELKLFDILKSDSIFDVDVCVLNKLVRKVVKDKNKLLSKPSAIAIIKRILIEHEDELKCFKRLSDFSGFCSELYNTICMYKSCNISYSDIDTSTHNELLNLKLHDIKLVYEKYEYYLENGFTDSFNRLQLLEKNIEKDTFKDTYFYFVGYTDITPIVLSIIGKLIKYSRGVSIGLSVKKDSNIYPNKLYYDLIDLSKISGINVDTIEVGNSFDTVKTAMLSLSKPQSYKSDISIDGQIQAKKFDNINDEIEYTLRSIVYDIRSRGTRYRDYQIVCPLLGYKNAISRYAGMYGVPVFLDQSQILSDLSAVRFILSIFDTVKNGYQIDDILNILHSEYSGLPHDKVCEYENLALRSGVRYVNKDSVTTGEVGDYISKLLSVKNIKTTVDCCSDYFSKLLEELAYLDNLSKVISTSDLEERRKLEQVVDKISSAITDINKVIGDMDTELFDYFSVLESVFGSMTLAIPPVSADTVMVSDTTGSVVQPSKYLYILGMGEGQYPHIIVDSGMITDSDINNQKNGNKLKPSIADINRQNRYKVYENLFAFEKSLSLSYVSTNDKGETLEPTMLVKKLCRLFELKILDGSVRLSSVNTALDMDMNNVYFNNSTMYSAKQNYVNMLKKYNKYSSVLRYRDMLATLSQVVDPDHAIINQFLRENQNNVLQNAEQLFKKDKYSVSQFEKYNTCPYMHFVDYGLKLKEKKDGEIKPADFGNILHEFLCAIVPILKKHKNGNLDDIEIETLSTNIITRVLSENYYEIYKNKYNQNIIKGLKRECITLSKNVLRSLKASSYEPSDGDFERRFVYNVDQDLSLIGVIDRVDIYEDDFRIIDYKTGSSDFKNYDDLASGKKLQLLVYVCAYKEMTGKNPKGAFYMPIKDNFTDEKAHKYMYRLCGVMSDDISDLIAMDNNLSAPSTTSEFIVAKTKTDGSLADIGKNMRLDSQGFQFLMDYVEDYIRREKQAILGGNISVNPLNYNAKNKDNMACKYCKYKGFCGVRSSDCGRVPPKAKTIEELKELK